ncbi:TetR/AcrR family transcriptional regulator [Arthrobacter sp. AK01]|uniref:TetR/AcrR family transcriptional regulator n=1 Tax=Arthrobacter sp. AK01 TaxID=2894084 RepID=UPI001E460666|nr:TetR/AcrR family transcriptional regulator [Arthrobacter sp. AK01]MCD4851100.1 TetR/AcrR family transcriptional regulator [Arthrobacter sp. AK01]
MSTETRPVRTGRPRSIPDSDTEHSPREQILDAAAALFVENGFTATPTRTIAERVGIRQASLYYHFANKEEMLDELLTASVRPGLEAVRTLEALVPASASAAGALHAALILDTTTLIKAAHNFAILWLLPEVQGERYNSFRLERQELLNVYGRLGAAAATEAVAASVSEEQLGAIIIHLTELISHLRRSGEPDPAYLEVIAATALRACGLDADAIEAATAESQGLRNKD